MTCGVILMLKPKQLLLPLDIAEFVENRNQTILRPKSHTCKSTTPKQRLSETLEVVSTSSEKGLEPYWNAYCEAINSGLLLPIGIDSPASAAKSYNSWSNKTVEKSWFSTKLFTVELTADLLQYSSFPVECTDSEDTVDKEDRNLSNNRTESDSK